MMTYGLIAAVIAGNVLANCLLKFGAGGASRWWAAAGLGMFGLSALIYVLVLRRVPLHVAQGIIALQIVGTFIASWLALGEHIPPMRWVGLGVIVVGVVLVAYSLRSAPGS